MPLKQIFSLSRSESGAHMHSTFNSMLKTELATTPHMTDKRILCKVEQSSIVNDESSKEVQGIINIHIFDYSDS